MKLNSKLLTSALLICTGLACPDVHPATTLVSSQSEYRDAVKGLEPGDTIVLANGNWKDFEILFTGKGRPDEPITLTAQEKGKVLITGQSNLRLAGEHLLVSGLVFKDGFTPTSEVISFRRNADHLAHHSRVSEVVIDGFNNPERTETDFWVVMYGRHNRFDHNHLAGKNNNGVTMAVRLNTEESQENYHRIDHNYFGHRPILGSNGGETLRIGTSHYSMSRSLTVVENNYFDRCDGEVEIISNKSGGNEFRGNLFFESRGTLTLRHGNDNVVENNVFLGNGVDHTGGIRVINKRQTVRNNYLAGLTGTRFGSALTIMNGVPDSPINRYHQVEDSLIENNTIINSDHIELAAGSDAERSAVPLSTRFVNNLVYNENGQNPFTIHDDISGIEFEGNLINEVPDLDIGEGFTNRKVKLTESSNRLMIPADSEWRQVGISPSLNVLERDATGVSWYPKPERKPRFDGGQSHVVKSEGDKLIEAVANAQDGDILELKPGRYLVERIIPIDKAITIRSSGEHRPVIEFERTALFEIIEGGALKLEGLTISGASAPDVAGNAAIRTSRYSMLSAYDLIIDDCDVQDLNVNHSFDFLRVAKGTFAEQIEIRNSRFLGITGAVLSLDKETDDLGLYNAEYVVIEESRFSDIGKALLSIYRGGTDESTFGPHVDIRGNELYSVGNNKRNKALASIFMLGVQVASISGNRIENSSPIRVVQTVGEPVTTISDNVFDGTSAPEVVDGEAMLSGNTFINVAQP